MNLHLSDDPIPPDLLRSSDTPFYLVNTQSLINQYQLWDRMFNGKIKPYYAVKCNNDRVVLETLNRLGCNFDCASQGEMNQILDLGVNPNRIIFANPIKIPYHLQYAKTHNITLTVFDSESELYKIASIHPECSLLLRIKADDSDSICRFNEKFGVDPSEVGGLLTLAQKLKLKVIGISFHVGSNCKNPKSFVGAIHLARQIISKNINLEVIDIGGGFPGDNNTRFEEIGQLINQELSTLPANINIIAEPGRYFVTQSHTLVTQIIGKRDPCIYYLNDGVYQSFNCTVFDHYHPYPQIILDRNHQRKSMDNLHSSTLFGPTCDSIDCIQKNILLPELEIGDYLIFPNMGAYTRAAASTFNGFQPPPIYYSSS